MKGRERGAARGDKSPAQRKLKFVPINQENWFVTISEVKSRDTVPLMTKIDVQYCSYLLLLLSACLPISSYREQIICHFKLILLLTRKA
jgi:hypothetical protein